MHNQKNQTEWLQRSSKIAIDSIAQIRADSARHEAVLCEIWSCDIKTETMPTSWQPRFAWRLMIELYRSRLQATDARVKDLVHATQAPQATVSRHLQILESEGWLTRDDCRFDGRVTFVHLTQPSLQKLQEWAARYAEYQASIGSKSR